MFPLDALKAMDPLAGLKRAKRIAAHTSFVKSSICVERTGAQQTDVPRSSAERQRHSADPQGVLHTHAVELDTFLAHEALRHVC